MAKQNSDRSRDEKKEDVNARRRERYANDPDYRARVLAQSRKHRQKKRRSPRIRMPRFSQPKVCEAGDGGEVKLFSVGNFATYVQRSIQSISQWEKAGILPPTPFRDNRGHRFYTKPMMEVVKEEIGDKRRLYPVDPEMYDRIRESWIDQGVPVKLAENGKDRDLKYVLKRTKTK